MNAYKTQSEKAWCEQRKNAMSYFEQILKAKPHETKAIRPLISHLKSKMNNTCRAQLEKQEQTYK